MQSSVLAIASSRSRDCCRSRSRTSTRSSAAWRAASASASDAFRSSSSCSRFCRCAVASSCAVATVVGLRARVADAEGGSFLLPVIGCSGLSTAVLARAELATIEKSKGP